MIDTLVFLGEERFFSSDFNQVGDWSLLEVAADETDPPAGITPVGEVRADVAGLYTAQYDVEFCDARASSPVEALAEDVVELNCATATAASRCRVSSCCWTVRRTST